MRFNFFLRFINFSFASVYNLLLFDVLFSVLVYSFLFLSSFFKHRNCLLFPSFYYFLLVLYYILSYY